MSVRDTIEKKPLEQETEHEEYEYVTVPPDGGFGWVIALAAMLCNMVCDGTLFAFGAMKLFLQPHFGCSDMVILMVGSVPCGVYLLVGPIVSGLSNRYGCRIIIIIGSIGASICMMLSTLSQNVSTMIIIYGIFGGIFFGMVYLPSIIMVSFYFEKKRAIANGLVTAGTGIGALSFPPLAEFLMKSFGWKQGMFVFAGIMLSCILFGAIMKPLKPRRVAIKRAITESKFPIEIHCDRPSLPATGIDSNTDDIHAAPPAYDNIIPNKNFMSVPQGTGRDSRIRQISVSSRTSITSITEHRVGVSDPENASRPLYKKDALFTGSKQQLHLSHTSLNSNPYVASITNIPEAVTQTKKKQSAIRAFADILSAMTDLSILKNKQMLLICIGNIFSMLGYYLPIMCLVSFAVDDLHVAEGRATILMTIFGACNTFGRFASGPIALIPHLGALRVHNFLLYSAGIFTVLAAYAYNFTTCALFAAFCGFAIAPHMSLLPNVVCDCVGLDRYTTAFGVLCLFRGFTSILGPPLAGLLKDLTKTYVASFVLGGAMIIVGSFFHFGVSFFKTETQPEKAVELVEAEKEVYV
ncbi:unnamed protein product [Adineta ricciae]|uniref:Uncharacterized protein n=1 Tax=Adineta ricciae TaxID=249248 RepID=A0A814D9B0_ADIRI|nr:unnamed protein product [Adineta ricciae]CAF1356953.1 unnamed protein product [Adineta ricciae]